MATKISLELSVFPNDMDIDVKNMAGNPDLFMAVENEQLDIVEMLLNSGADANNADKNGVTLLMTACKIANEEMIRLLLRHGACVHTTCPFSGSAFTQTCCAGGVNVLQLLLDYGADVNEGDGGEATPLLIACQMKNETILEFLLQNGANVKTGYSGGKNILMLICGYGDIVSRKLCQILLHYGADVDAVDENGRTVLMTACSNGQDAFVGLLLEHGVAVDVQCKEGKTALMYSAETGSVNVLNMLIVGGADLDLVSKDGCSVLSYAMMNGEGMDCVKRLLQDGTLLLDGQLKHGHKNVSYSSCSLELEAILYTIQLHIFEWQFCSLPHFKQICFAAMKSGISPGEIPYKDTKMSPLIVAFLENDSEAFDIFLTHRYHFVEDYRMLCRRRALKSHKKNFEMLDKITHEPLGLFVLSFLTVSKSISQSADHNSRSQRVDALPIPELMKKALKFQM